MNKKTPARTPGEWDLSARWETLLKSSGFFDQGTDRPGLLSGRSVGVAGLAAGRDVVLDLISGPRCRIDERVLCGGGGDHAGELVRRADVGGEVEAAVVDAGQAVVVLVAVEIQSGEAGRGRRADVIGRGDDELGVVQVHAAGGGAGGEGEKRNQCESERDTQTRTANVCKKVELHAISFTVSFWTFRSLLKRCYIRSENKFPDS